MTTSGRASWPLRPWLLLVVLVVASLHAPGQLSVDSVIALHEAATGSAFGWTPTLQSALLAWLGGGEIAAALHVAMMLAVAAFALESLLGSKGECSTATKVLGCIVVLNPMIWLMLGVVWRDVLVGVAALAGVAALLAARRQPIVRIPWLPWSVVVLAATICLLARQPGFLIAAGLIIALLLQANNRFREAGASTTMRLRSMSAVVAAPLVVAMGLQTAVVATVKPSDTPGVQMDGVTLVLLFDVAGMWVHRPPEKRLLPSGIPPEVAAQMRSAYTAERVDGLLGSPGMREWAVAEGRRRMAAHWWAMFKLSPSSYVQHRWAASAALLGFNDVRRCVPGYWGVAGLPHMVEALGLQERMDARDRLIGRIATKLAATPAFWNVTYVLALAVAVVVFARRAGPASEEVVVGIAGLAYAAFFVVAGIACDVRYLFPVVMIASALALALTRPGKPLGRGSHA